MVSGASIFWGVFFVHKLMYCLQPVEVPVEIDIAAYDVQAPCKPGLNRKGRV